MTDLLRIALSIVALFVLFVVILLSLPGRPFSLKALNLRRGVVGCNRMFVLLASLLFSLRRCLQLRPLCTRRTWHSVISFLCCSAYTKTVACDCDLATDSFGSGSLEFGPIGALPCAL